MQQLSASKLAFFASLLKKKHRNETGLTWVEGRKLVLEALSSNWQINSLVLTRQATEQLPLVPVVDVWIATDRQFERLSEMISPDGWGAVLHVPELEPRLPHPNERGLILQGLSDPGNLGTLIRLADWFGLDGIWMDEQSTDPFSPKVIRSSMGSAFRIPARQYLDLDELLICYKDQLVAAHLEGKTLWEAVEDCRPRFIMLGSESHGLVFKPKLMSQITFVHIPRFGRAESLNVASAAAILCWAFWGQTPSKSEG